MMMSKKYTWYYSMIDFWKSRNLSSQPFIVEVTNWFSRWYLLSNTFELPTPSKPINVSCAMTWSWLFRPWGCCMLWHLPCWEVINELLNHGFIFVLDASSEFLHVNAYFTTGIRVGSMVILTTWQEKTQWDSKYA